MLKPMRFRKKVFIVLVLVTCLLIAVTYFLAKYVESLSEVDKPYQIKVANPTIIDVKDESYACLMVHNNSEEAIVKLDLYKNALLEDGERVDTWPAVCNIKRGDSCVVKFKIENLDQGKYYMDRTYYGFKNKYVVATFANGDTKYFTFPDSLHLFRNKDHHLPPKPDNSFRCLGKGLNREENFDKAPLVTINNVRHLYREYIVDSISNTDLYFIYPERIYYEAYYFSRLIKFAKGKQVAAKTFYGWHISYIYVQGRKYMIGLNSLATTAGCNTSTFTCKTVLLDSKLNVIKEREFRYPDFEYTYFDTLAPVKNGYEFTVINTDFDPDCYYEYKGRLSLDNIVTKCAKRKISLY